MVEVDKLVSFLAGMCGTSGCLVGRPDPKKELLYLVGCCLDFDIRYENKFLKWGGNPPLISFHKVSNKQPKSEKTPVWAIWRPFEEANPPKTRFFGTLPNQRFLTPWAAQS